ncbi:hypothetical protein ASC95_18065 [Pelomonas sp. Root1217]|uniref:efflux transporter outer membrane subunit n=1 Tax=Pelomonas sp. Root1217 TaxID=1736430 RepID=UPI00070E6400|nr:efflux transporter outer membrane subunit [Pelomonas sp. Root1217]KQV49500.1 hypothetical protein ASC95_18065 [Pelomonas sp. Root1217]
MLGGGCASGPLAPDRAAVHAATPSSALWPIEAWWSELGDARLSQRIERALQRNADLGVAAARIREAHAILREAGGARLPSVLLASDASRARASTDTAPVQGIGAMTQYSVGLEMRYEVDLWGRVGAANESARARLGAELWARKALAWSVSTQVAELHLGLAALERQRQIAASVVEGRQRALELRGVELNAGAGAEFEVRRVEVELAAAEATLAQLHRQHLQLGTALTLLVGDGELSAFTPALEGSSALAPRLPAGELGEFLARRPDVIQEAHLLAASTANVKESQAARLPSLQLSGRLGSDVRELGQLFSATGMAWALAGSLTQSLFDGGRTEARVEQAEARVQAQRARHGQAVLKAMAEAREAMQSLEIRQQSLDASRRRVKALNRTLELAHVSRAAGGLSRLDELDAERQLFQAQLDEVEALRQQRLGELAVYKALAAGPGADAPAPGAADLASLPGSSVVALSRL